jgi:hypothetical protein
MHVDLRVPLCTLLHTYIHLLSVVLHICTCSTVPICLCILYRILASIPLAASTMAQRMQTDWPCIHTCTHTCKHKLKRMCIHTHTHTHTHTVSLFPCTMPMHCRPGKYTYTTTHTHTHIVAHPSCRRHQTATHEAQARPGETHPRFKLQVHKLLCVCVCLFVCVHACIQICMCIYTM